MIVFVPAYDEATRANHAVALKLPQREGRRLFAAEATRELLLETLARHGGPLFAMAHGKPRWLVAQGGSSALVGEDAAVLKQRPVFAFACHTAAHLGSELAREGITWWGYIEVVTAPDHRERFLPLFVRIFGYIQGAFASADSPSARLEVLHRIKELCEWAALQVDEAAESDPRLDVMEALQCLRDTWQLLRVWGAHSEQAQGHPHAPPIWPRPPL